MPAFPTLSVGPFARYVAGAGETVTSGRLDAWADQSGNANDAAKGTNGPWVATDNFGRRVIRFDPQTTNLAATMTLGSAHTFSTRNLAIFFIGEMQATGGDIVSGAGASAGVFRITSSGANNPLRFFDVGVASGLNVRANPALQGVVAGSSATKFYTNTGDSASLGAPTLTTGTGLTLKNAVDALEIIIIEGAPTAADIQAIKDYAAAQYNLRTTAYTRQIVFEGDSITQGVTVSLGAQFFGSSYPSQVLGPATADWKMSNLGASGSTIISMASRAPGADGYFDATCARNVLLGQIGRNDATTRTASAIYTDIVTYVQGRVTAGYEVWWGTCIMSGNSTVNAVLVTLNGLLRGTPFGGSGNGLIADAGATKLVDFGALPQFDAIGDTSNTTYYQSDGTHPTPIGAGVMASLVIPLMVGSKRLARSRRLARV